MDSDLDSGMDSDPDLDMDPDSDLDMDSDSDLDMDMDSDLDTFVLDSFVAVLSSDGNGNLVVVRGDWPEEMYDVPDQEGGVAMSADITQRYLDDMWDAGGVLYREVEDDLMESFRPLEEGQNGENLWMVVVFED